MKVPPEVFYRRKITFLQFLDFQEVSYIKKELLMSHIMRSPFRALIQREDLTKVGIIVSSLESLHMEYSFPPLDQPLEISKDRTPSSILLKSEDPPGLTLHGSFRDN